MGPELRDALGQALKAKVVDTTTLGGGDINEAFACRLDTGRDVFVKTCAQAPAGFFEAEAAGLNWLAEPGLKGGSWLRTPKVLAYADRVGGRGECFLALELIEFGRPNIAHDQDLGRGLARLHRSGAQNFGSQVSNFIGTLPQDNAPCDTWAEFYLQRRLLPQYRMAQSAGLSTAVLDAGLRTLAQVLPDRVGPVEPPSRLHGDLWGGNSIVDASGAPVLIDPAVYGGHREMDLAMMKLFGGFRERVFEAYNEEYPLAPGFEERVPLYQLYPLLVHLNLFGQGYLRQTLSLLNQVL